MTIKRNIAQKEERNINMQNNLASMIKEKKLFLLDIDGTVALGSELLPGAADFLQTVKENGGIFRFLTNNSSKAASDYVEQFHDWGIETTEEEFITAGTYARDFMKKYYGNEKILVAATETYCSELRKAGLNITDQAGDDVDCVLCAYDIQSLPTRNWFRSANSSQRQRFPGLQQIRICVAPLISEWYRTAVPSAG